jgi:hypothetical protein
MGIKAPVTLEAMSQTDSKPALSPEQQAAVEAIRAQSKIERPGPDDLMDRGDLDELVPHGQFDVFKRFDQGHRRVLRSSCLILRVRNAVPTKPSGSPSPVGATEYGVSMRSRWMQLSAFPRLVHSRFGRKRSLTFTKKDGTEKENLAHCTGCDLEPNLE